MAGNDESCVALLQYDVQARATSWSGQFWTTDDDDARRRKCEGKKGKGERQKVRFGYVWLKAWLGLVGSVQTVCTWSKDDEDLCVIRWRGSNRRLPSAACGKQGLADEEGSRTKKRTKAEGAAKEGKGR